MRNGFVYMMTNRKGGTLYVGVTSDLSRRIEEHRLGVASEFTSRYQCTRLVWYQRHELISRAIIREKIVKKWLWLLLLLRRSPASEADIGSARWE